MSGSHPLREMLDAAARGQFPPVDGRVDVMPPPEHFAGAVIGFTGHFVVAADLDPSEVRRKLGPEGDFSVPMSAAFLTWVAEQVGSRAATFDALLCAFGEGSGPPVWLHEAPSLEHPRVARATRYRHETKVFTAEDRNAVLIVGRGLCGRWEIGYEVAPDAQGRGLGRRLVAAARGLVPAGEPVWAQVAPGNAASLRSTTAGGFVPVAAEVLFPRSR